MRPFKHVVSARRAQDHESQKRFAKKFLKINCIAGIIVGALLFGQDVMADNNYRTWADFTVGSKHFNSDGYYVAETYRKTHEFEYTTRTGEERVFTYTDPVPRTYYRVQEWTEFNPGLGIRKGVFKYLEVGAGIVKQNSFGIPTLYAGVEVHTDRNKPLSLGLNGGLVDGYADTPAASVMPLKGYGYGFVTAQYTANFKKSALAVRVMYAPVGDVKVGILQIGLSR